MKLGPRESFTSSVTGVGDILAGLSGRFTEKEVEELYISDNSDLLIARCRLSLEVRRGMEDKDQ